MTLDLKGASVVNVKTEDDILGNGNDGSTALKGTRTIVLSPDIGSAQTIVTLDGDLSTITTGATNPLANTAGAATAKWSSLALSRWTIAEVQRSSIQRAPDGSQVLAPQTVAATIAAASSLSGAVNFAGKTPYYLFVPSTISTTFWSFQLSYDGTTYFDVFKGDGTEYQVSSGVLRAISLDQIALFAPTFLKIRSGTRDAPVAQNTSLTLNFLARFI